MLDRQAEKKACEDQRRRWKSTQGLSGILFAAKTEKNEMKSEKAEQFVLSQVSKLP